ncbi:MAG TPA: hypothetical protein VJ891_15085 [Casimicrobiaceae bacterium]|nr:hypothetical protein [Casimicrobiaceae bacterium]
MDDEQRINGMSVNERLAHLNLFPEFDAAIRSNDKQAVIDVLIKARFTVQQAEYTATTVLNNPRRYGF